MRARLVSGSELLAQPGDIAYLVRRSDVTESTVGLMFRCPGCGQTSTLYFGDDPTSTRHWQWNKDQRYPSVTPNVGCPTCGWEGKLKDGSWLSVLDLAADSNRDSSVRDYRELSNVD